MTRFAFLPLALGTLAACTVGDVPDSDEPPPGVICDKKATPGEGYHRSGLACHNAGCHVNKTPAVGEGPYLMAAGTVYEKNDKATLVAGATVTIMWAGGEAKYRTANDGGKGNFFEYAVQGITYPATVKVSLCPAPEKAMIATLKNEQELNCTKSSCHTDALPIYIKD